VVAAFLPAFAACNKCGPAPSIFEPVIVKYKIEGGGTYPPTSNKMQQPLSLEQLVVGQLYTIRFKISNTVASGRTYEGINEETSEFYGITYLTFSAGLGASFSEYVEKMDIFTNGTEVYQMAIVAPFNTARVQDLGTLVEGQGITLAGEEDPITREPFADGDVCIRIIHPDAPNTPFVYTQESISGWFARGNYTEPKTRLPLRQSMLARFIYRSGI
jgi:hypothetical protein